jgi:hypothetical protein
VVLRGHGHPDSGIAAYRLADRSELEAGCTRTAETGKDRETAAPRSAGKNAGRRISSAYASIDTLAAAVAERQRRCRRFSAIFSPWESFTPKGGKRAASLEM